MSTRVFIRKRIEMSLCFSNPRVFFFTDNESPTVLPFRFKTVVRRRRRRAITPIGREKRIFHFEKRNKQRKFFRPRQDDVGFG